MTTPQPNKTPSKWWWIGHIFFGIITGLVCYLVWKDENLKAAKKHLIHSIWIGLVPYFIAILPFAILFPLALD